MNPASGPGAAVYLASEKAASFVTGSDIVVDGGFLTQNPSDHRGGDLQKKFPWQTAHRRTGARGRGQGDAGGKGYRNSKVLLIVPDGTRTGPVGMLFKAVHEQVGGVTPHST
ncbi:MAG: hypothetical protein CM1200mP29_09770 [Verrucomicrobiota bacterium]|nr:MAG: hypothetical protein CM1200mP29_09770 [Verrucomicrobiota bacterium]